MSGSSVKRDGEASDQPPQIRRDAAGDIEGAALADVIQWFLDHDQRVAVVRHPAVEELFQWKQEESRRDNEEIYLFNRAEDRLAIGIMQALVEHDGEEELHGWISQLLNTLDEASKANEEISGAYQLETGGEASVVKEAEKIPTRRERLVYLTYCWLETLCTAEIRVLGWVYQEIYGRPFHPENF
jgi:hypothetical protein